MISLVGFGFFMIWIAFSCGTSSEGEKSFIIDWVLKFLFAHIIDLFDYFF